MTINIKTATCFTCLALSLLARLATGADEEDTASLPKASIDGSGPDWQALGESDFVDVNCEPDTWAWQDGVLRCTGQPVGVLRSHRPFTNFELVVQWRHLEAAGNSGIFIWTADAALANLKPGELPPGGIEVQVLDLGYADQYEKSEGKKGDWFTTHGDVFPVGSAKMKPFPPTSPSGERSFPRKQLTKAAGQWNHYYIRAINGEIRLWVNGEEVSGGSDCQPHTGYLCLESEGAPVEFKNLRIRELP